MEDDDDSESDAPSDGQRLPIICASSHSLLSTIDLPPRTPSKKHDKDEESVTSSKRDESPVLKKAQATIQLRSDYLSFPRIGIKLISLSY